jgi:hypothetical protein
MRGPLRPSLVLLSSLVLGCGSLPPSSVDDLTITSAQPPSGSVPAPGSQVTLTFTLSYQLVDSDSGKVVLVVSDQLDRTLNENGNFPTAGIARGKGNIGLSYSFTVPSSGVSAISVTFPLFAEPSNRTALTRGVRYDVHN